VITLLIDVNVQRGCEKVDKIDEVVVWSTDHESLALAFFFGTSSHWKEPPSLQNSSNERYRPHSEVVGEASEGDFVTWVRSDSERAESHLDARIERQSGLKAQLGDAKSQPMRRLNATSA
jgi:hypothetical protein